MVLFSPIGGYPYPALADAPNAQSAGASLTSALDLTTLPQFASDAAVAAAIPSPVNGQSITRTDIGLGTILTYSTALARWVAQSALIAENVLTVASGSVTFSSIPQVWRHLRIVYSGRSDGSGSGANSAYNVVRLRFNSDTSNNYASQGQANFSSWLSAGTAPNKYNVGNDNTGGVNAGTNVVNSDNQVSGFSVAATSAAWCGAVPGNGLLSTALGGGSMDVWDYTLNTRQKHGHASIGWVVPTQPAAPGFGLEGDIAFGYFPGSNSPITSVTLLPIANLQIGSRFSLYGLA